MRPRTITLLSLPKVCEVCGGNQATGITWLSAMGKRFAGRPRFTKAPCWHCQLGVPVVHLAMRRDG